MMPILVLLMQKPILVCLTAMLRLRAILMQKVQMTTATIRSRMAMVRSLAWLVFPLPRPQVVSVLQISPTSTLTSLMRLLIDCRLPTAQSSRLVVLYMIQHLCHPIRSS